MRNIVQNNVIKNCSVGLTVAIGITFLTALFNRRKILYLEGKLMSLKDQVVELQAAHSELTDAVSAEKVQVSERLDVLEQTITDLENAVPDTVDLSSEIQVVKDATVAVRGIYEPVDNGETGDGSGEGEGGDENGDGDGDETGDGTGDGEAPPADGEPPLDETPVDEAPVV